MSTGVFYTSATFNISGLIGANTISSWAIKSGGGAGTTLASGLGDPTGDQIATALTPNTAYTNLVIVLTETSGCSSTLNFAPTSFATTPFAPTAATGTAASATSITANWTDGSANPNGSTYQIQYCTNAVFTVGCATKNVAKVAGAAQTTTITGLTEETSYYLRVKVLNVTQPSGTYHVDSDYFVFTNNPIMTLNAAPVVPAPTCTQIGVTNSATCTVTGVTDNDLSGVGVLYQWSVVPAAGTSFTPASTSGSTSGTNSTTFAYPSVQSYTVTVTVTDHNGTGLATSNSVVFNPGQVPTTISIAPGTATVGTGQSTSNTFFTANVYDQNGTIINGQAVNWSIAGAGNSVSTANGTQTGVTAGATPGNFALTASLNSITSTATITIVNSGVTFTVAPAATVFLTSATLTATATQFSNHTLSYTWSVLSGPGGTVSFNPNGAVSASGVQSTSVATLPMAGAYTIQCTATDTTTGLSATQSVSFSRSQVLRTISVTPNNVTISIVNSQTFMAAGMDQFSMAMTLGSVSWSSTGGNISGAGVFSSASLGNNIRVTATSGGVSGSALVSVVNYDVTTSFAYPTPYKSTSGAGGVCFTGLGSDAKIRIYTVTGRKVFETEVANSPAPTTPPHCDYTWTVKNTAGESVASGVYLYVIESPTTKKNGKLIIIQ